MGYALDKLGSSRCREIAESLFDGSAKANQGRSELIGRCPLPGHEDKKASAAYNWDKDVFNCSGCHETGDLVWLWGQIEGHVDEKEAFKAFAAEFVDDGPSGWENHPTRRKTATKRPKKDKKPDPGPFLDEAELEQWPRLPKAWLKRLQKERGWSPEVIRALDLRLVDKGGDKRIGIPIRDGEGRLVNIRLYLPKAEVKVRSYWTGDKKQGDFRAYGKARLWLPEGQPDSSGPLWLCEGEPDCICALSHGLAAATVTGGAGNLPAEALERLKGREVVVAYDADKPGREGAAKVAKKLAPVCKLVRVLRWPPLMYPVGPEPDKHGQDLTDWFITLEQDKAGLMEQLARAKIELPPKAAEAGEEVGRFFLPGKGGGRGAFKSRLVADEILDQHELKTDPTTGLTYRWTGQVWEELDQRRIRGLALRLLDIESTRARAEDVAAQVTDLSLAEPGEEFNSDADLLCLNNGTLHLHTLELLPHRKTDLLTNQLQVEWRGEQPHPTWENFLDEIIANQDVIAELQEFFGYCLTRSTRYAKALLLVGPGSDGKSTLLNVLQALVGEANCSAVDLASLENEFHRAGLVDKLVNVFTEVEAGAFSSQFFKAIVSGDLIGASFKHRDVFQFRPVCKLAFSANNWPRITDTSYGFFRRVLPIQHVKQFRGEAIDPNMIDKLLAELPGILAWSLNGLRRLRARGRFEASAATRALLGRYQTANNPVQRFVDEMVTTNRGLGVVVPQITKAELYKAYQEWCKANSCLPMTDANFARDLLRIEGLEVKPTKPRISDGRRQPTWVGIRLLTHDDSDPAPAPPPEGEPANV